ncbi:MAG: hypothetical protein WCK37_01785 [Candidatus Falkowbacteria bacterium]
MRNVSIFLSMAIVALLSFNGCKKDPNLYINKDGSGRDTTTNKNNDIWTYAWNYQPQNLVSSPTVSSLGTKSSRGYPSVKATFTVSLANSKVDPRNGTLNIPHVGPGGVTIYSNVANDATYTIEKIDKANGTITVSIATDVPPSGYTDLLFNFNVDNGDGKLHWFQAYGTYAKCKNSLTDDGSTNIYAMRIFYNKVDPLF